MVNCPYGERCFNLSFKMLVQYFLAACVLLSVSFAHPLPDSSTEALVVTSDETLKIYGYFLAACHLLKCSFVLPAPNSTTESPVVKSNITLKNYGETRAEHLLPEMKSIYVVSNIRNRFARTVVTSKYANPDSHAQQATFSIVLPDTAFIAGFIMEIDGKQYEAYVRDKAEAKEEYQQAISQGRGAAHVAVDTRDSNRFTVSVNIEPQSKVIFILTYEELLVRKHSMYEIIINLHPGQLLKDLGVDVNINETRPILNVEIPALRYGNEFTAQDTNNDYAIKEDKDRGIHVSFHPTIKQQRQMARALKNLEETKGISGQFVVKYDVERDPFGGEVLVNDGYFVHFFAPNELKPIPKHVVFVLDVSASMYGRKIEQLRDAMTNILGQLSPDDYFNLVKFHYDVQVLCDNNTWLSVAYPKNSELPQGFVANAENIKNAQEIISKITDERIYKNSYDALIVSLRLTSRGFPNLKVTYKKHKPQPIIVFLTDEQTNVGESGSDKMIEMVEERNNKDNKAAVFTLAFSNDLNNNILNELAIQNSGFSKKIYEGEDASLQLQDFYKTISSPLLTNINFKYSEDQVKDLTKHKFDILFKGSECVVAGKIDKYTDKFVTVEGLSIDQTNKFYPTVIPTSEPEMEEQYGSLERLWAYLTIKQLLDKKYEENENLNKESSEKLATKLALKYSFVTSVTSLVVVKPNMPDSTFVEDNLLSTFASGYDTYAHKNYGGGAFYYPDAPPTTPSSYEYYTTPYQNIYRTTTYRPTPYYHLTTRRTTGHKEPTIDDSNDRPTWLQHLISTAGELTIDNKLYEIGNNETSVEHKTCHVESLNISGNCTLLIACPKVYHKLDTFETYKTYFCSLSFEKYAGVCCSEDY